MFCSNCGKEIDENSKFCPNCGKEMLLSSEKDNKDEPKEKKVKNKKKVIIFSIISILIIISISIIVFSRVVINNKNNKKEEYSNLLTDTACNLYLGELIAEYHVNFIADIWYNAIYEIYDTDTNPYLVNKNGGYRSKYNGYSKGIKNYLTENENQIKKMDEQRKEILDDMKKLQELSGEEYPKELESLKEMYKNYNIIVDLAISPTGSYVDYVEKINEYIEAFNMAYNEIQISVPEITQITTEDVINELISE